MIARLFLDHPASVGESYGQHFLASSRVGLKLGVAALACFVHALVPGLCKTTGSTAILKLHDEIAPRRFDQPTF
jgi:hypothetical protein